MPRPIWSGNINFGLVSVPVKLYSAVSPKTVRFHQLHAADHVRIQQKRVCPADGQEVPYEQIVKGYEIAPDRYVVIEPEELAGLGPERLRAIEIEDFVQLAEIDPIYYDHPYYLVPGAGGSKPYQLLMEAMRETQKVAVARVVLRTREQLVAIRPMDRVLGMMTMNYADEVLDPDGLSELPEQDTKLSKRELQIAGQLIDSLSGSFQPSKYRDTYREAVLELIERKAEGHELEARQATVAEPTKAPDLMSALKASLQEIRGREGAKVGASNGKSTPRKRAKAKPERSASR
jgi:DNA end-binding protein Ku